jgi:hypothetical protein
MSPSPAHKHQPRGAKEGALGANSTRRTCLGCRS